MSILYTKVKLYLEANSKTWDDEKVELANYSDGNGDFIKKWNYNGLAKPTAEQIASYETDGNTAETLQAVLTNRKKEYPSMAEQLDDIYHNGIDAWKATIKITKDKYPKE